MYLSSGFTYDSAEQAEHAFKDEIDHFLYSRFANPTVAMFEQRLAALEGAQMCVATGSGMSAMFASVACMVSQGDRVVAAAAMFSSCYVVLNEFLPKWGVEVEFISGSDLKTWERALSKPTKAVFIESPSNPTLDIVDIKMVSDLAHSAGALVIVDNVMASPVLQRPLALGADVVMYSATKHIDGQGRVLGGAILGDMEYQQNYLSQFIRHTGPNLSAFNAWILLKSLETIHMRVNKMSDSAKEIANFLAQHKKVSKVNYPGLDSHPGHAIAKRQMSGFGSKKQTKLGMSRAKSVSVATLLRKKFKQNTKANGVKTCGIDSNAGCWDKPRAKKFNNFRRPATQAIHVDIVVKKQ